jgi:Phage capsid family
MTIIQKVAQVSANPEHATRTREFASYTRYLLESRGALATAREIAEQSGAPPRVVNILKSAVAAGDTTDPHWAGALADYNLIAQAFFQSLAPFSAFDAALNDFLRVPLHTRIVVTTTGISGHAVGQGEPKPVSKLALTTEQLVERKVVAICAVSAELVRLASPPALDLINNELRRAVALKSDETFLDILTQTSDIASSASTGMSAAQFSADLASALDSLSYGSDARLFLVLPPASAQLVAFMRDANGTLYPNMTVKGGDIAGIRVVVSDAATDAVLFDASQIAAHSDTITIDASAQASIQLDDAATSGAAQVTSLWQSNLRAMRATRYFGASVLRPEAVAVITGVTA